MRRAFVVPAALALSLAACGSSKDEYVAYCPEPFTVQDAERLTHFKDGPGRDPRDIAYEAVLTDARSGCKASRRGIDVTLVMRISAVAGPSVSPGTTRVPYFVRVLDASGAVVQGQDFAADFRLSGGSPRGASREELSLFLPHGGNYRIAVGLKPTPEELNYNRRSTGR
ncbi:hypothetical protein [Reyranella sp.]|uniref:hypothetical protein n=1 Tax=Reyranella sp. TaxID=1929291 RepID=UPI003BAD3162